MLPSNRNIIHIPLSVELIKISSPVRKEIVQKDLTEKSPKEKLLKEKKEKETLDTSTKEVAQPVATTRLTLEAAKFPYMYYLAMIRKKVALHWDWPSNQGVYKTIVYFRILQSGEITQEKFEESSRNELFDTAAFRAIKLCRKFSPLPAGFTDDYLGVYFEFSFKE